MKAITGTVKATGTTVDGARGEVVRKSPSSGMLTVKLLEDHGAYKAGDTLHLGPYEFKRDEMKPLRN